MVLWVVLEGDGRKLHLLNLVFLILIPKKLDAVEVKDFHPISLVHSFAKLVTKILANCLAPWLNSLVFANQSAFVRGRCIHDNFLLVHQMARFLHNRGEPRLLLKLDINKAFDSISFSRSCPIWASGDSGDDHLLPASHSLHPGAAQQPAGVVDRATEGPMVGWPAVAHALRPHYGCAE